MRLLTLLAILSVAAPAQAFNALGHKVIADVAWQELTPETRKQIVDTLRRHPRFDEDFAKEMPAEAEEDRWIFQQAAIWPDIARGFKGEDLDRFNRPTWHYINVPLFPEGERPLFNINQSREYPPTLGQEKWNVAQALQHCRQTLAEERNPPDRRWRTAGCSISPATSISHCIRRPCSANTFPPGIKAATASPSCKAAICTPCGMDSWAARTSPTT